ncbi:MAG: hypothetical protein JWN95_647 [Frankiales bacterium]|nr:hypothetical protein [Frankiales bacterium]
MSAPAGLPAAAGLADFVPMAQRAADSDGLGSPGLLRLRAADDEIAGYVRLPYDLLAGRVLALPGTAQFDITMDATEFARWAEAGAADGVAEPSRRDAHWLTPLPPRSGWSRIEVVPDATIRDLVRTGALLARDTSTRQTQQSLVSSVVLRAESPGGTAEVPLGALSALTRMGFLPRGSQAAVDVAPGWLRMTAPYGSTFVSTGTNVLGLLGL